MDNKDFTTILDGMKDLTLRQIFRLITRIKYRTAAMILAFTISTLGGAFIAGQYSQQKETAVMLESPFSMRIEIDGNKYDFENLTLMKDPTMPTLVGKVALSIREIRSSFDVMPVGKVIARVEESKVSGLWKLIISQNGSIISEAYAQPIPVFQWNGHGNDFKFKEQFINNDTVHRYYLDGCILEYRVDGNRRSIPSTFRWIKVVHGSGE